MTDEDKEVNVDELEEGPGKSYEFFTKVIVFILMIIIHWEIYWDSERV